MILNIFLLVCYSAKKYFTEEGGEKMFNRPVGYGRIIFCIALVIFVIGIILVAIFR